MNQLFAAVPIQGHGVMHVLNPRIGFSSSGTSIQGARRNGIHEIHGIIRELKVCLGFHGKSWNMLV